MERKLRKAEFTLEDFLGQMKQVRRMGPLTSLLGMIPGLAGAKELRGLKIDERELDRIEAIILSMTAAERRHPELIKGSRRLRIARGSGTNVQAVNQLVKQFHQMRKLMKRMGAGEDARPRRADAPGAGTANRSATLRAPHMSVRLRLTRVGGKKDPIWRVVVADQRSPRDGRVIETVGRYNAQTDPSTVTLDEDRVRAWLATWRAADRARSASC